MISDDDLAGLVNALGAVVFVMIAAYHYVAVNHPSLAGSGIAQKRQPAQPIVR
jgi:hypothetical protein